MPTISGNHDDDAITSIPITASNAGGGSADGVISLRNRKSALGKNASNDYSSDCESLANELDFKKKQEFQGWSLLWLAWQATGVIYGDIGTSPLYVYSNTFSSDPTYDDLLGVLSLIIWSLTLIVTVKYMLIVLQFNDEGEGGTFALYTLLARYANITERQSKDRTMVRMKRCDTNELKATISGLRNWLERSRAAKLSLKLLAVMGVSLIMADGLLTPAQSVLGAIQGVQVINPSIEGGTVVGISCAILILLFLIQPLGISKLATGFAPIVVVWLLFNAVVGIYNLVVFDHSVLKAFSPYFAGAFLVCNGEDGWRTLSGVLLAFTGCEALFADLGAFSKGAISLSWGLFAFPCLLLAYVGQAAFISVNPSAWSNPFFNCVPPGTLWFSLIIAVLAAIVASQALVTATFQLLSQVMKLSYFPQIKVVHTSKKFYGQIYIPLANWLLMIGTVIVTAVYSNTTNLGNAYGVCVILVTFITTCMVSLSALIVWRLSPLIVLPVFLIFAALDGAFLSSALTKFPNGAWFTLVLAAILSSIFVLWRYGKEQQWAAEAGDRLRASELIASTGEDGSLSLRAEFGSRTLTKLPGFAIFFDKIGDSRSIPHIFTQYVSKFGCLPQFNVFLHLRPLPIPSVEVDDRYALSETGILNCYHLAIRYGYTDDVLTEDLGNLVATQLKLALVTKAPQQDLELRAHGQVEAPQGEEKLALNQSVQPKAFAAMIESAYENQILYILGKEQMRIKSGTNPVRAILLGTFLWIRDNTRNKMASLKLSGDRLAELGFVKNI